LRSTKTAFLSGF